MRQGMERIADVREVRGVHCAEDLWQGGRRKLDQEEAEEKHSRACWRLTVMRSRSRTMASEMVIMTRNLTRVDVWKPYLLTSGEKVRDAGLEVLIVWLLTRLRLPR